MILITEVTFLSFNPMLNPFTTAYMLVCSFIVEHDKYIDNCVIRRKNFFLPVVDSDRGSNKCMDVVTIIPRRLRLTQYSVSEDKNLVHHVL